MRTCLAVSSHLAAKHVDRGADSQRANGSSSKGTSSPTRIPARRAIREAIRIAKEHGTKIALTCSEAFIVEVFGDAFRDALAQADLLFCNATEAKAVTKAANAAEAFEKLQATSFPRAS